MGEKFLFDGPNDAAVTILLAHGAGAPMDSASMTATASDLMTLAVLASGGADAIRKAPARKG